MRRLRLSSDDGSAALEFVTAGLLLLVPLVYLVIAVAAIQGGALAVEGASRQAARVFVQSQTSGQATARAESAVQFGLADFGVDQSRAHVRISCEPEPSHCLTRRGFVTVTITASIPLPLAPTAIGGRLPLAVPVRATTTEQVSRFWDAG